MPDEDLDLYAGRYEMGYDRLRELNFDRLKAAGIIPPDSDLPPRNPNIVPFDELSADQQRRETRSMELYASMVDNLDRHVGRLIDYLRDNASSPTRTLWSWTSCRRCWNWREQRRRLGIVLPQDL